MIYGTWSKRRNSLRLVILLGFMLILGLPFCADAAPVGKVTYLEGNVDVTPTGGKAQALKLNDPVNLGDILRTKSRSRVEVTFTDGNVLRLAESTRLKVTQYAPGENQKSYLNLFRGKTQSIVGALKKGSQYEIHTPTAICGVRGTNFFSFFINGVSGSVFQEGSGYGYNPNFPQDVKQVATGEVILVTHENAPPIVRPATAIELEKHLKDTAPGQDKKDEDKKDPAAPPSGSGAPPPQPPESPPPGSPLGSNPVPPYQPNVVIRPTPPTPGPTPTPEPTPEPTPTSGSIGIQSATVTGMSFSLAGTLTSPTAPSAGPLSNVVLGNGSSFSGYVAGVPGSWNGAISGIYRDGSHYIGLVSGTLTGAITGAALSASGQINLGGVFGSVSNSDYSPGSAMSSFDFPVYQFKTIDGSLTTYDQEPAGALTGYQTTNGGILAVWGIANTGTYNNPGHATLSTSQWATYTWGSRIIHGTGVSLTDDSEGHTVLTGLFKYMDTRYRGFAGLHYFGSYDAAGVYKTAGAGYYALSRLAFTGEAGSNVVNYVYANNNGAWAAAGKISFLLGADTIPWSSGPTTLYHGGDIINISQAYSGYSHFLWNAPVQGYDVARGSISDAYNDGLGGGYINGFSGGILTGTAGAKSGWLAALYLSTDRTQAGWLTGPIASTDPGAWMGEGTLTKTVPGTQFATLLTTDVVTVELGSLTGKLAGNFGISEVMAGTMAGNVPESGGMIAYFAKNAQSQSRSNLPWGIYNIKFGGNFAGKPDGGTSWTATAGGAGSDFDSYGGGGYWLGTVANGTWSAAGELNGAFSGSFLTDKMMGTWQGPFYGINSGTGQAGSWIGESIGTYTGTPLKFFSPIEARKVSGGDLVLSTFHIPTTGSGLWWDVAVVETVNGASSLYRINTIASRSSDTPPIGYTKTPIGPISTPIYFKLTWGASPSDLDSHAWIPANGPNPLGYHVYYGNEGNFNSYPYAYLDRDARSGYGPEILSFSQFLAGDTFYSVYNYSDTPGFTSSGATVSILYGTPDITPIFNAYFGGTDSLFTPGPGSISVSMMGQFVSSSALGTLWLTPLYSDNSLNYTYTTYDGGAYKGYMVGTKIDKSMSALMYALYVSPSQGATPPAAGYLRGSLTGTAYPDIQMFSMDGSLFKTQMPGNVSILPEYLYDSIYFGIGAGSLAASLGYGGFSGVGDLTIETQAIKIDNTTQPWGIYKFTDWGVFTNPGSAATWTGKAGGSGIFGAYVSGATLTGDGGYWLADLSSGAWTGGKITGLLNGTFLTTKKWGSMSGDVLGVYQDSNQTWQTASVGAWTGMPLSHVSSIDTTITGAGMSYFNGSALQSDGSLRGLVGGTASLWTATAGSPAPLLAIGSYSAGAANLRHVWGTSIRSDNYDTSPITYTTYDGGAYWGYVRGIENSGSLKGQVVALYIDPSGNAGYLKGGLTGTGYPGIGMFEMTGSAYPIQMATTVGLSASQLVSNVYVSTSNLVFLNHNSMFAGGGTFTSVCPGGVCVNAQYSNVIIGQNWSIWRNAFGGTYSGTTSDSWTSSVDFADAAIASATRLYGFEAVGSKWSGNEIAGQGLGYSASIWAPTGIEMPPSTWISVGDVMGTYNPNTFQNTFQAITTGMLIETGKFLTMQGGATNYADANAALKALNIPAVQVGAATLSGSGNNFTSLSMNDVRFFAFASGGAPKIWATGSVTGAYASGAPVIGNAVALSGDGLSANFTIQQWNSGKWLSTVTNGVGELRGGSYTGGVNFRGAGAGTFTGTTAGAITGTAAGVAKPASGGGS
ncbi:MAG: hypothetical protein C0394_02855 [Syntrophus sp. (in: bacteria)]|nr:hypothetical protein [Syntrophus sp. (in: bacteria)]